MGARTGCDPQKTGGGSRSQRMVAQWPALAGQKISQTVFNLEPCAMRPAHVHPRATGLLYVVSGARARWHGAESIARTCPRPAL